MSFFSVLGNTPILKAVRPKSRHDVQAARYVANNIHQIEALVGKNITSQVHEADKAIKKAAPAVEKGLDIATGGSITVGKKIVKDVEQVGKDVGKVVEKIAKDAVKIVDTGVKDFDRVVGDVGRKLGKEKIPRDKITVADYDIPNLVQPILDSFGKRILPGHPRFKDFNIATRDGSRLDPNAEHRKVQKGDLLLEFDGIKKWERQLQDRSNLGPRKFTRRALTFDDDGNVIKEELF